MEKLFNYLLNRSPSIEEIKKLSKNTFEDINQFILNTNEYKEILCKSNKEISIIIKKNLGDIKINKKILSEISNIYKINNYQSKFIIKYINIKKLQIKNIVDTYLQNYFLINTNLDYKEFYEILFQNKFDYTRIDFYIVNSKLFLSLVEIELNKFYKKNKF